MWLRVALLLVRRVPLRILERLETVIRISKGQGWASETVEEETEAGVALLRLFGVDAPVVLDIGANRGTWTQSLLAKSDATIYAFEPSSSAFESLSKKFFSDTRVTCLRTAVGFENGETLLYFDSPGSGLGSLSRRRLEHFGIDFSETETVPIMRLDTWITETGVVPDLIKMDVEGHEFEVLKGAVEVVAKTKIIQFEFGGTNIDSRTYFQDFFYFFDDMGFRIQRLTPRGLVDVPTYRERDEVFSTTVYFAIRNSTGRVL